MSTDGQGRVPFHVPYQTGRERAYLDEVFERGVFAGNGPFSRRCEAWLAERVGSARALMAHSCTGALELAAMLAGVGPGDEVLLPSFTFVATATSVMRTGATPVFCDMDAATMNLDPADVERRITPNTRAIVPVHYGGVGVDMPPLQALADEHGLLLWEDAAQGLGAARGGQNLGSIAPMACLSFHETKNVHCGLAGALLINDPALVEKAEIVWERGTNRQQFFKGLVDKYSWVEMGSSFYPSELQMAFLLAQLEGLDDDITARRRVWDAYAQGLADLVAAGHVEAMTLPDDAEGNGHLFWIRLPTAEMADSVRERCRERGVVTVIHYVPLHTSKVGRSLGGAPGQLPVTEDCAPRLLRLPMFHGLTDADVARVLDVVHDVVGEVVGGG
jgi:dTDP-4-amino-4,6-dideoxygalactose transaminase